MKKFLTLALSTALMLSFAACGNSESSSVAESMVSSASDALTDTPTDFKIGIGAVATTSESRPASSEEYGNAGFDTTVCALCVDDNGNILAVRFDTIEAGLGFDAAGAFTDDIDKKILTKREIGDDYGIGAVSDIGKEWYQQIDALESWMVGKSINEVMSMKVYERDADHRHVPDEEDLKTSVTISVTDQLRALEKAYADATGNLKNFTSSYFDEETAVGSEESVISDPATNAEDPATDEQYSDKEA